MKNTCLPIALICLAIFTADTTMAQLSGGFESNNAWYIDDPKIKLEEIEAKDRLRSNTYLRLDYRLRNFSAGIQLESYAPKALLNYAPVFNSAGLASYYLQYRNDSIRLEVTLGHFYEQFGSGLVFRSWEDRQLGIANSIAGARVKYSPIPSLSLTALGGRQRNGLGVDFTDGSVLGFNADWDLSQLLKSKQLNYSIGASHVRRSEDIPGLTGLDNPTHLSSVRGRFQKGGFNIEAEYAFKSADALVEFNRVRPELSFDGDAYLLNVGFAKKGFGINGSFRRTENFAAYTQRNLAGNVFNQGLLNYIPALTKQYDYSLTNIYVYAAQPNLSFEPDRNKAGEIGGQLDLVYHIKKGKKLGGKYGTQLSLNYAQWHGLQGLYDADGRRYKADLAAFGQKYYQDISLEIRKKWKPKWSAVYTYLHQYYNARYVEEALGEVRTHSGVVENTLQVGKMNSVRLELQHQWADGGFGNWAAAQVEFNLKSSWSFFITDLYNYGNENDAEKIHFYNTGIVFKKGPLRIQTNYGRQRGGLVCVGGVCRFVPQSAGLNWSVNYSF